MIQKPFASDLSCMIGCRLLYKFFIVHLKLQDLQMACLLSKDAAFCSDFYRTSTFFKATV